MKKQINLLHLIKNRTLTIKLEKFKQNVIRNNKYNMPAMRFTISKQKQNPMYLAKRLRFITYPNRNARQDHCN